MYSESENVPLYAFIHRSLPNPLPHSCKSEQASAHIAHSSLTEICEDNIFEHIFCQHIKTLSVLMLCSNDVEQPSFNTLHIPKNGNVERERVRGVAYAQILIE